MNEEQLIELRIKDIENSVNRINNNSMHNNTMFDYKRAIIVYLLIQVVIIIGLLYFRPKTLKTEHDKLSMQRTLIISSILSLICSIGYFSLINSNLST